MARRADGSIIGRPTSPEEEETQRLLRQQAEQVGNGLLSWLNPFNWGFGGLLLVGLVGFGLYFFGATDRGREMIGNFFNGLSPEWQQRLAGWGASLGLLPEGLTGESATALMAIGRRHGVTGFNVDDYLQPDILFEAMTTQPQAVLSIARGLPRGGNTPSPTTQRAMGAVRAILNNSERLNTLLNSTNRANTYALLDTLSPVPFAPGALGTFIDAVGLQANGQVKPEFARFLTNMLNDNETQRNAALTEYLNQVAQTNASALQGLVRSVNLAEVSNVRLRGQLETLQGLATNATSMQTSLGIADNLRRQGTSAETLLAEASTITGVVNIMTTPEKLALLEPNLQRFGILANTQASQAPVSSPQRMILDFFGTGQNVDGRRGVAVNVQALHTFFKTVAQDPQNRSHIQRTREVMSGMMVMMGFQPSEGENIPPLNPQQVAAFFRNEANVRAFDTLLHQINPGRLPEGMRTAIAGLRDNWAPRGGNDTSYMDNGLAEVFGSPRSVEYLMTHRGGGSSLSFLPNGIESWIGSIMPTTISGLPAIIRENTSYLIEVRDALANAGVSLDGAAAAPARVPATAAPARNS